MPGSPSLNLDGSLTQPRRVRAAVIALWAAWLVSAVALFVNQVLFHGVGIGPGPSLGIMSLVVQAIVFWFVGRGSQVARVFVLVFVVLAALPLAILPRLVAERAVFSAVYLVLGFVLKGVGAWLLFSGKDRASYPSRER